jgi:hypothetical protein
MIFEYLRFEICFHRIVGLKIGRDKKSLRIVVKFPLYWVQYSFNHIPIYFSVKPIRSSYIGGNRRIGKHAVD